MAEAGGIDTSIYNRAPPKSPVAAAQDIGNLMNTVEQNKLLQTQVDISQLGLAQQQFKGMLDLAKSVEAAPPDMQDKAFAEALKKGIALYKLDPAKAANMIGALPKDPKGRAAYFAQITSQLQNVNEHIATLYKQFQIDQGDVTRAFPMNARTMQPSGPGMTYGKGMSPDAAAGRGVNPAISSPPPLPGMGGQAPEGPLPGMGNPVAPVPAPAAIPPAAAAPAVPAATAAARAGSPATVADLQAGLNELGQPKPAVAAPAKEPELPEGLVAKGPRTKALSDQDIKVIEAQAPLVTALQEAGQAVQQTVPVLRNMQSMLTNPKFVSGPAAEKAHMLQAGANQISAMFGLKPVFDEKGVADQEEFAKLGRTLAGMMPGASSSDQRQMTAMMSNPNEFLSKIGNKQIITMLIGNAQATQLKSFLMQKALEQDSTAKLSTLDKTFNQLVDPRVFQLMNMTPDEQREYLKTVDDKDALMKKGQDMMRRGWLSLAQGQ